MEYKEFKPAGQKNTKKIILVILGSLLALGLIGFVTVTVLRQLKAPTLSGTNQAQGGTQTQPDNATPKTPAEALVTADAAAKKAAEKATSGDQKAALVDYKVAYDNYKVANNTARAAEIEFSIKAIEAALAVPANPAHPTGGKTAAKE
jgi:predicted lipid-binding transport protein (Tim44 family)